MAAPAQIDPRLIGRYRGIDQANLPGNSPGYGSASFEAGAEAPVVDDPAASALAPSGNPYGSVNNPSLNNTSTTNPIYGNVGAAPGGQAGRFATTSAGTNLPTLDTDPDQPIHNMFFQDQALETGQNQQIYNEAQNQLGYYGPIQQQAQQDQNEALSQLKQTPGYTGAEQTAIAGDPNAVRDVTTQGIAKEQAQLDQYGTNVNKGLDTLNSGLSDAQGKFSKLDSAVNDPSLAFDPNGTEKQVSDADVQEMKNAAGTRVGNQYRSAEDTLMRQAAAAGNTNPLAVEAARARLLTQSAADQGDAEVNADIAARQAQQQQATSIEQQRQQAANTRTGYKAGAATTEQSQAQSAAGLAGTQAVQAQENIGQTGLGQTNTQTQQGATAAQTADQATSQRAADAAQTRITGQGNYRTGVAQQQGLAQQGGQTAVQQQQNAANTTANSLNTSTANRANYENKTQASSIPNMALDTVKSIFKTGGIVTEPTVGVIAENGPEWVGPATPRYRQGLGRAA